MIGTSVENGISLEHEGDDQAQIFERLQNQDSILLELQRSIVDLNVARTQQSKEIEELKKTVKFQSKVIKKQEVNINKLVKTLKSQDQTINIQKQKLIEIKQTDDIQTQSIQWQNRSITNLTDKFEILNSDYAKQEKLMETKCPTKMYQENDFNPETNCKLYFYIEFDYMAVN